MANVQITSTDNSQPDAGSYNKKFMFFIAMIAALGGMLFGYDTGVIASALIFIEKTFKPTIWQQELIVSMVVAGAFLGAMFSGRLANKYGRRKILIWTSYIFIFGTIICTFSPEVWTLILGRFILGIAVGIASFTAPLYIVEISIPQKRGLMVVLNSIFLTGAQALSFLLGYILHYLFADHISWRIMIGIALIPSILLLIGMIFAPESPRWLIMKGFKEKGKEILGKIRDPKLVEVEFLEIEKSLTLQEGGWRELFSKTVRPVLVIGLILGILQQFAGINTVMYYGPVIFQKIGFTGEASQIIGSFGMACVNLIVTLVAMFTVDKLGRKPIMLIGMSMAVVSLFSLAYVLHVGAENIHGGQIIAVLALMFFMVGYAYSIGTLFWLIISEIFPLKIRSTAMGFVAGIQWLANFLVASTFLTVLNTFGNGFAFSLCGLSCLFGVVFTIFYLPETKGVSLETIELNLENGVKARDLGKKIVE